MVQILSDSSGVPTAGSSHSIQCIARREDTLPPSTLLEIIWLDNSNNEIISPNSDTNITGVTSSTDTNITSTLTFPYTRTSQAGRYTCAVNMTIPDVVDDHLVMKTANVYVRSKFFLFFLILRLLFYVIYNYHKNAVLEDVKIISELGSNTLKEV